METENVICRRLVHNIIMDVHTYITQGNNINILRIFIYAQFYPQIIRLKNMTNIYIYTYIIMSQLRTFQHINSVRP